MNASLAIHTDRLSRDYGTRREPRRALDDVTFSVTYGSVVGLLGPNGAGKTTCVRILTTLLLPSAGTASIAGADVIKQPRLVRRAVGVSFGGDSGLYTRLSGRDNLRYFGTMYNLVGRSLQARVDYLLERVRLQEVAKARVETYSRGMRQRLHIARALLHDPPVLLLDEPSSGLDPDHARKLRALVSELCDEGRAILLTTHDMLEAEQLCQQVIILDHGRILRGTTVRTLRAEAAYTVGHRVELETQELVSGEIISAVPGLLKCDGKDTLLPQIYTRDPAAAAAFLMDKLGDIVLSLHINAPSLEDAYLATVGST